MSIEESNRIIAEFMGMHLGKYGQWSRPEDLEIILDEEFSTDWHRNLKYHSSWDWLMPVWNKLWYHTGPVGMDKEVEWSNIRGNKCARAILYGTIVEAHREITAAIQWYNTQNTQQ